MCSNIFIVVKLLLLLFTHFISFLNIWIKYIPVLLIRGYFYFDSCLLRMWDINLITFFLETLGFLTLIYILQPDILFSFPYLIFWSSSFLLYFAIYRLNFQRSPIPKSDFQNDQLSLILFRTENYQFIYKQNKIFTLSSNPLHHLIYFHHQHIRMNFFSLKSYIYTMNLVLVLQIGSFFFKLMKE